MLLVVRILMYFKEGNFLFDTIDNIFSYIYIFCSNGKNHLGISESARVPGL